ncbi:MAG: acyclic terpene utilization AtuA family protein, partial [Chloroflexi bacterium]|nr:acyclic terpene utilization AtuA family protein [Chloroflexota bacterium]
MAPATHELRVLVGGSLMHGGGLDEDVFKMGLALEPDVVGADAGSSDPGPHYLGAGKPMTSRYGLKRSLEVQLVGSRQNGIPLVIGSAGIGGARPQVELFRELIDEIAHEHNLHFRLATIYTDVDKSYVKDKIAAGRVRAIGSLPELTPDAVDRSTHIVGMAGIEPLIEAFDAGADVILSGRCSDSAVFASYPILKGFDQALAWHMAKTIECGAAICEPMPGVPTGVLGRIRERDWIVEPTNPNGICPRIRVAAHTLYEQATPDELVEPGGITDTSQAVYEQLDPRRVVVTGARFTPKPYSIKLEGAELMGYRTISLGAIRDPYLIDNVDEYMRRAEDITRKGVRRVGIPDDSYQLLFRVYGQGGGRLGPWQEPVAAPSGEVVVIGEAIADTQ